MPTNVISLYSFEITLTKKMSPVLGLFFKPTLFYVPCFFSLKLAIKILDPTLTKKMSPVLGLFFKSTLFYVPRFFCKAGNKDSGSDVNEKMSPVLGLFFKPTLFYVPRFFSKAGNKDSGSSPITAPPELWKSFE
jgi:hypothetical protein